MGCVRETDLRRVSSVNELTGEERHAGCGDRRCGPDALGKGKATGSLAAVHPVDLLATPLRALAERNHLDPALLDDVVVGTVSQVGEQAFNVGRRAVLAAGFPERVPATTVDRQCGSSQQAISFAAQGVQAGAYDLVDRRRGRVDEPGADGLARRRRVGPRRPALRRALPRGDGRARASPPS